MQRDEFKTTFTNFKQRITKGILGHFIACCSQPIPLDRLAITVYNDGAL